MPFSRSTVKFCCLWLGLVSLLVACASGQNVDNPSEDSLSPRQTPPATPFTPVLQVSGTSATDARLRFTLRSITLPQHNLEKSVQLFLALVDADGTFSYLLYPANRAGFATDQFDLSAYPIEVDVSENTQAVTLWVLAIHNTRYRAAEMFGVDALAASLGIGFHSWRINGDPLDDPLAAVVAASDGALYEWYAGIEVVGQVVNTFSASDGWDIPPASLRSQDGKLNVVYSLRYVAADGSETPNGAVGLPSPTPSPPFPNLALRIDDSFSQGESQNRWYEGQDSTYINHVTDGAYEIRLTAIEQREFGLSWGSIEGERFENYVVQADVRLVEDDVVDGRYGIWFHYQDDYNFIYFGISNRGEYRIAVIQSNSNRVEIQDWTPHEAIRPGAATNTLQIVTDTNGEITLGINGEDVATFTNSTFTGGSVAFFCYAESVPTTCRLEHVRIWEPAE